MRAAIFQLQQNGPPGSMRPFLTDDGRESNISFFYPDHKGETIVRTDPLRGGFHRAESARRGDRSASTMDKAAPDAGFFDKQKLLDRWYYMLGPMLPTRGHTPERADPADGRQYAAAAGRATPRTDGLPEWLEDVPHQARRRTT